MRALYRTYGSELYGFAMSCLGDRGQAEELVQEVFTRVWRHAGSYDPEKASFRTWLYGIARNAIIDLKRRQVGQARARRPPRARRGPRRDRRLVRAALCSDGRWAPRSSGSPRASPGDQAGPLPGPHPSGDVGAHRHPARDREEPHLVRPPRPAPGARGDGGGIVIAATCSECRLLLGGYVLDALETDESRVRAPPPRRLRPVRRRARPS